MGDMLITLALHVALAFPPALPPAVARFAVAEAAGIWAPYGVTIDVTGPCGWAPDQSTVLEVVTVEDPRRFEIGSTLPTFSGPGWHGALGAVRFAPDGTPAPVVTVFMTDLQRLVAGARVFDATESKWPRTLRERVIGRVLGRVLAHEIGHVVLRMPQHVAGGLMRPLQRADDLVAPSRHSFTLSPAEAARLIRG
jgi:hypothetical protein